MKTKTKRPKAPDAPLDSSPPIIKPRRRRASQGDPIVAKKMVGIRASLQEVITEYRKRVPVDETAALHQLVLYGHRYPLAVEDWIAAEMARTKRTRARIIEKILWDYVERVEAERSKPAQVSSARAQEKEAQIVETLRADVKTPGREPQRK